jgi:NAD-specific glutamate dehydrogenase
MTDRTEAMDNLIAQDADLIDVSSGVTEADREVLIRISNSDDETAQRIRRGLIYTWEVGEISRHRLEERAKIVAWLRGMGLRNINYIADAIEVGEHLK